MNTSLSLRFLDFVNVALANLNLVLAIIFYFPYFGVLIFRYKYQDNLDLRELRY